MPASSGAEENDQQREATGYNNSIYLMVGVPYAAFGVFGFMVYRAVRKRGATAPPDESAPPA